MRIKICYNQKSGPGYKINKKYVNITNIESTKTYKMLIKLNQNRPEYLTHKAVS